jgi:uncharacterized protein (DUF433 family)
MHLIERNPKIMGGEPVLKGTRIPIARVMALIAHGYSVQDFKTDYPYLEDLTAQDLKDLLKYYETQITEE